MEKVKVVIEISGGNLQSVASNNPDLEFILVDWDNIKAGDDFPDSKVDSYGLDYVFENVDKYLNKINK